MLWKALLLKEERICHLETERVQGDKDPCQERVVADALVHCRQDGLKEASGEPELLAGAAAGVAGTDTGPRAFRFGPGPEEDGSQLRGIQKEPLRMSWNTSETTSKGSRRH
jgi:hypothetical protein